MNGSDTDTDAGKKPMHVKEKEKNMEIQEGLGLTQRQSGRS